MSGRVPDLGEVFKLTEAPKKLSPTVLLRLEQIIVEYMKSEYVIRGKLERLGKYVGRVRALMDPDEFGKDSLKTQLDHVKKTAEKNASLGQEMSEELSVLRNLMRGALQKRGEDQGVVKKGDPLEFDPTARQSGLKDQDLFGDLQLDDEK